MYKGLLCGILLSLFSGTACAEPTGQLSEAVYHLQAAVDALKLAQTDFKASREFDYSRMISEIEKLKVKVKQETSSSK